MKKEFHYEVICENLFMEETGNYRAYGIKAVSFDAGKEKEIGKKIQSGKEIRISDISLDGEKVQSLVDTFNAMQLDTIHLQEAVEDFLVENAIDTGH